MRIRSAVAAIAFVVLGGQVANVHAEVVIETVTVGNPGNAGEDSGECVPGGYGPCRVCGVLVALLPPTCLSPGAWVGRGWAVLSLL